jgi:hypothetical protein
MRLAFSAASTVVATRSREADGEALSRARARCQKHQPNDADDGELQAGRKAIARAYGGKYETDRARAELELDDLRWPGHAA